MRHVDAGGPSRAAPGADGAEPALAWLRRDEALPIRTTSAADVVPPMRTLLQTLDVGPSLAVSRAEGGEPMSKRPGAGMALPKRA